MKALTLHRYATPPEIQIQQLPRPEIARDELLVAVKAAALNQLDLKIAVGAFKLITGHRFPRQMGADFSGEVVAAGAATEGYGAGDEVYGYVVDMRGQRGTFAQYLAVKAIKVARKPTNLSHEQAAAMPCVYQTALQGLRDAGRVRAGQRVLVYGASGGVGTAALQLARHFGAHVIAVSSAKNLGYCLEQGAHEALAYDQGPVWERLGAPVDLVFQVFETADNLYRAARKHLTPRGRFIVSPNPRLLLPNLPALVSGRFKQFAVRGNHADLALIAELAARKVLVPTVQVFDFDDHGRAFAGINGFKGRGKTVLKLA